MDDQKMRFSSGFSLPEVLVSLVLVTGTSLALLKQQWQMSQLVMDQHHQDEVLLMLDGEHERAWGAR